MISVCRPAYYGDLLHDCLHTSCCDVQLSVQEALLAPGVLTAPPKGLGLTTGPSTRQEFWQLMAPMSQLFKHAVELGPAIRGVGVSGVGVI